MALALGYAHPDHLLRELTSWQLAEWLAYNQLEPFGETRADLRAGIVASTIANANRDAKRRKRPFMPAEFMPEFEPKAPQSMQEQLQIVEVLNRALGGRDLRGRG